MSRPTILGLVLLLFPLACVPLSLSVRGGNFADDELSYYLPSIERISAHWPSVDLVGDSTSATSPGYCYFLAGVSRISGKGLRAFRFITIGLSTACLLLLCAQFPPRQGLAAGMAILPLAASNFFIKSASWIVTDNAALLLACASLVSVVRCADDTGWAFPAGLSATAAVFVRQLHAWLVAPIAWAILVARPIKGTSSSPLMRSFAWSALLPPLAMLCWLRLAWGGFVPPAWQKAVGLSIHPASAACALSIFAAFGVFYLLSVDAPENLLRLARGSGAAAGAAAGFLAAVVSPNVMDRDAGRWGGYFWALVGHSPALAGRSLPVVAGSALGGALLAFMTSRLRSFAGTAVASIWLVSVASWIGCCTLNPLAFQRYSEPPVLVFLIVWLAIVIKAQPSVAPPSRIFAPLAFLSVLQAAITVFTTYIPVLSAA